MSRPAESRRSAPGLPGRSTVPAAFGGPTVPAASGRSTALATPDPPTTRRTPDRPTAPRTPGRTLSAHLLRAAPLLSGRDVGEDGTEDTRRAADATCGGRIDAPAHLTMRFHTPSTRGEPAAVRAQVRAFNTSQDDGEVRLVNGGIPATGTGIERTEAFVEGGPGRLDVGQSCGESARLRPQTPAYAAITAAFAWAFARVFFEIMRGAPVRPAPDEAARAVGQELADRCHYPPTGP